MAIVTSDFILGGDDPAPETTLLAGSVEGAIVELPFDPSASTPLVPSVISGTPIEVYKDWGFYADYYFRIWVWPYEMTIAAEGVGVPQVFDIWNAFPGETDNTLNTVADAGTAGTTVTPTATDVYTPLEAKTESTTAPAGIFDTTWTFTFTNGEGTLHIVSAPPSDVYILDVEPMGAVSEAWEYNTDIMVSENATEQRVAIRQSPVHRIAYNGAVKSEADRGRIYNQLHKSVGKVTHIPYWHYNTNITSDAIIGDTDVFCIPDNADIRDGDYVLLTDSNMDNKYFVQVTTVSADRLTLSQALTFNVGTGWLVFLTLPQILADGPAIQMRSTDGSINIAATDSLPRSVFERPGASPTYETLDGFTILTDPPKQGATEAFDTNKEVLSTVTGLQDISSTWSHPLTKGIRSWVVKRSVTTMDYWRGFFSAIKGRQGSFLLPSWHADFELSVAPVDNYTSFEVVDTDGIYESDYFPYATYKRIMVQTDGGTYYRNVSSTTDNGDGTFDINLSLAIPTGTPNTVITKVSFLQLTRLDKDVIEWTHGTRSSELSIMVRNVDA